MRSFAIVIRRAYFEAKKRSKYAKNVVVTCLVMNSNSLELLWLVLLPAKMKKINSKTRAKVHHRKYPLFDL